MSWHLDQTVLKEIQSDPRRKNWLEEGSLDCFSENENSFAVPYRDRTRLGSLLVTEFRGTEGLQCWLSPVEGYPKILGTHNLVKLFDSQGKIFYEGTWGAVSWEHLSSYYEFFIFLEPKGGHTPASKPSIKLKVIGAWRLLKHKFRKRKSNLSAQGSNKLFPK